MTASFAGWLASTGRTLKLVLPVVRDRLYIGHVPISQTMISLLNLPVSQLRQLASAARVELPRYPSRGAQKWDYVIALGHLSDKQLRDLAGDWLLAGRTSMTWFALSSEQKGETPPSAITKESVASALRSLHETSDPFNEDLRPSEVTAIPQLVDVRDWGDGKIVFTFVVACPVAKVIHNFEVREVLADEFFVGILRTEDRVFEVRANQGRATLLANTWLIEFAGLVP